jgi:5-methylcytosine-specific restriction endonuclease McrA
VRESWDVPVKSKTGKLRQFKQWQVPKGIRDQYALADGDEYEVIVRMSKSEGSPQDLIIDEHFKLTSDREFVLPAQAHEIIQVRAEANPTSIVYFEIVLLSSLERMQDNFDRAVEQSRKLSFEERQHRLASSDKMPKRTRTWMMAFRRNPYVAAEVLERAKGVCESCGVYAPFRKASNGDPYLEVHHVKRLIDGGEDTIQNAIAVCPNCHRRQHHGVPDEVVEQNASSD